MVKNVMLNLFQHLIESNTYETLNQVQGDKKGFTTWFLKGEGKGGLAWNIVIKLRGPFVKGASSFLSCFGLSLCFGFSDGFVLFFYIF